MVVHWCNHSMVQWFSGTLVHCYSGTLVRTLVQWYTGWYGGTVVQ